MRKLWSLILVGVFIFAFCSGVCSQEKIIMTIQDYFDPAGGMAKFIDEFAVEFEKANPNVEINHIYIPFAQLLPTILQQALTNTLPEIYMADNPWVPQLIMAGAYKDITDKVEEWGWENWEDFFKGHRDLTSQEGRIYAFQVTTNNLALFYRKNLLEKAGISNPPETWSELNEDCKKIKDSLGIEGLAICATSSEEGSWQFLPFLWSNGGSLLELDQPEAIEALQFLADMVEEGYIPRDVVNVSAQGDLTQWLINEQVGMMLNGNWEFGWHLTPDVLEELGDVDVATVPVPEKGMRPIVPFGGECYGISATIDSAKYDWAWEFLRSLVEPDNLLRANIMQGGLPTRASVAEDILIERPMLKPFLDQAQYALPRPLLGGMDKYPDVSSELWIAIQKAFTGIATPEESLKEAAKNIQNLFSPEDYEQYKQLARNLLNEAAGK